MLDRTQGASDDERKLIHCNLYLLLAVCPFLQAVNYWPVTLNQQTNAVYLNESEHNSIRKTKLHFITIIYFKQLEIAVVPLILSYFFIFVGSVVV